MTNLLNRGETPNLLELVEAHHNEAQAKTAGGGEFRLPLSLIAPSLCADEATDTNQRSVCADRPLIDQSICADERADGPSVCTDEGPTGLSICADEAISDARLKTDIEQVGTTVYGLPLYHFRYMTGRERFEGVMAQDVLEVMPDAVVMGEDGYYRVRYAQLGIKMTRA